MLKASHEQCQRKTNRRSYELFTKFISKFKSKRYVLSFNFKKPPGF